MPYRETAKMAARKLERRTHLIETATQLFGKLGYHATTVPMIVDAAAISTGSFYSYFRNKEDVFNACLEVLGGRVTDVLEQTRGKHADPIVRIRAGVIELFLFLASRPKEARLLIVESSGLGQRLEQTRRKILARQAQAVRETLEECRGRIAGLDTSIAAHCLVGAVLESLYHWFDSAPRRRTPATETARTVADFAIRGLGIRTAN
jgi:TetR/AcrR family transcriptional regulator, fatty acid metabolism regulator protein